MPVRHQSLLGVKSCGSCSLWRRQAPFAVLSEPLTLLVSNVGTSGLQNEVISGAVNRPFNLSLSILRGLTCFMLKRGHPMALKKSQAPAILRVTLGGDLAAEQNPLRLSKPLAPNTVSASTPEERIRVFQPRPRG